MDVDELVLGSILEIFFMVSHIYSHKISADASMRANWKYVAPCHIIRGGIES